MSGHDDTGSIDVAVLDADERQSLVALRSLGRRGLRVGAFDSSRFVPAYGSRWCSLRRRLPHPAEGHRYVDELLNALSATGPAVVVPARDATIEALRARRLEIERLTSIALADEQALEVAIDKRRTLALAEQLGIPVPSSVVVEDAADIAAAANLIGFPAVVKPVQSWSLGRRLGSVVAANPEEACWAVERAGGRAIVQELLGGSREAVSLFCVEGVAHARFAQVADRMLPPLGGSSVVRESIPLPADLTEAAEALVHAAALDGYTEVEFRRDLAGKPFLMEINPRLSASVEVAVRAGVDFPWLLYAWAAGRPVPEVHGYRTGVRMRWLGGDIQWLSQTIAHRGALEVAPSTSAVWTFARDSFTRFDYDYAARDDPLPPVVAAIRFVLSPVRRRVHRALGPR